MMLIKLKILFLLENNKTLKEIFIVVILSIYTF